MSQLASLKVLIADDHFLIRQFVRNALQESKITNVQTAADGNDDGRTNIGSIEGFAVLVSLRGRERPHFFALNLRRRCCIAWIALDAPFPHGLIECGSQRAPDLLDEKRREVAGASVFALPRRHRRPYEVRVFVEFDEQAFSERRN